MTTATRYKVIDTALCIGESVFDGEVVVVLASEYDRDTQALMAANTDLQVNFDTVKAERDELRAQVEAMRAELEKAARGIAWLQASVPMSIRISKQASKYYNAAKRAALQAPK